MKEATVLRKALALFGPLGSKWHQPNSQSPTPCYCTQTAIIAVCKGWNDQAQTVFSLLGFKDRTACWQWNDAKGRTFAEVKDRYEQAIARAEAA